MIYFLKILLNNKILSFFTKTLIAKRFGDDKIIRIRFANKAGATKKLCFHGFDTQKESVSMRVIYLMCPAHSTSTLPMSNTILSIYN